MLKKSFAMQLLFLWVAFHLLAPYTAYCAKVCTRPGSQAAAVIPPAHGCCPKDHKPSAEIQAVPGCVCPSLMQMTARLNSEVSLVASAEKVHIPTPGSSPENYISLSRPDPMGASIPGHDRLTVPPHATPLSILRI